jgi:hypothetical protein
MRILTGTLLLLTAMTVHADEGMWTFHDFPAAEVKQKFGVEITPEWLDHVRTATVRLSGCTASFISPEGLILTNHHCTWGCLAENSTKDRSLFEEGFLAADRKDEIRCRTQVADVLMAMENITAKVAAAVRGLDEQAAGERRRKTLTELEQACEKSSRGLKCQTVNLYNGGQYWLYKYQRYDDVRVAFAPEKGIGAFGGDPDNFQFPRWCLDMTLLRAYDKNGKPVTPPNYLQIDFDGPEAGEPVFVSGHPGSTNRLLTVSQLLTLRDIDMPQWLLRASELRGRYLQFAKAGPEAARIVEAPISGLENGIKVRRKLLDALHNDAMLARKREQEAALRATLQDGDDPWATIEEAQQARRALSLPYVFLESGAGFNSRLFDYARTLVRAAAERPRANTDRLREFRDAVLPRAKQQMTAEVPVYPELEELTLSFALERMREWLGPDHPVVRQLLATDSPESLARRLVSDSKLADPKVRMALWQGGAQAVQASDDPMIELARAVDAQARAVRKRYEDEVEAPVDAASERIAQLRFKAYGTAVPPDATFTLRLNPGTVQGWMELGEPVEPFTRLSRLFERATGQEPFRVPDSWMGVKDRLDMDTRFNLVSNNDIVGGNSGSPLINARGDIVGLIFDGNIHSISGSYSFDPRMNRAVSVHPAIMKEALSKVYGAEALLREITAPRRR